MRLVPTHSQSIEMTFTLQEFFSRNIASCHSGGKKKDYSLCQLQQSTRIGLCSRLSTFSILFFSQSKHASKSKKDRVPSTPSTSTSLTVGRFSSCSQPALDARSYSIVELRPRKNGTTQRPNFPCILPHFQGAVSPPRDTTRSALWKKHQLASKCCARHEKTYYARAVTKWRFGPR